MKTLSKVGQLGTGVMLDTFLNSTEECIVVVNKDGYIEALSRAYASFLQVDRDKAIGKHVTKVIENTRMHIVLKTGVSEVAEPQNVRGESMIASRIPIFQNGKVVGAMGWVLFKNLDDFRMLYDKIGNIEEELELYKASFTNSHRPKFSLGDIITVNQEMLHLKKMIARVSKSNSGVLLLGESGTGKELIAHSIHSASKRAQRPFISLNCGAIPPDLLESELFGYEAGAFTGAHEQGKIGLFNAADRGCVFLDEVGELSLKLQVKLLRFLQEKEIKKIGSNDTEKVDVRIIAATNRNLVEMMDAGDFRSDLYYRLSIVQLNVPPLRERLEDIKLLTKHLIKKICRREGLGTITVSEAALGCMQRYDWPGNVRELENILESATNFVGSDRIIGADQLPARLIRVAMSRQPDDIREELPPDLRTRIDNFEKECILTALQRHNNNRSKTAASLGLCRTSLYEKMVKHGLTQTAPSVRKSARLPNQTVGIHGDCP